ncbi:hypothetical protein NKH77_41615 [Streptomyces sp. M19]
MPGQRRGPRPRLRARPGLLTEFAPPSGPFVRVDTHAHPGWRVGPDYDSLLAKAVVWAPDREQALARMDRALGEFRVAGEGCARRSTSCAGRWRIRGSGRPRTPRACWVGTPRRSAPKR